MVMAAKTMAILLSTLLLSPVTLIKISFADSVDTESRPNPGPGHEGAEMGIPIPNTSEMDQNAASTTTLELRLANSACPRLAQVIDLAGECTRFSPLRLEGQTVSDPH